MSAKNVMNSDNVTIILGGVIAQSDADSKMIDTIAPLLSFTAKKNGYVRISCDFMVENDADDQSCSVFVEVGRTETVLGLVIPYTAQPVLENAGFGSGHYVIKVVAGTLYDVIGTSTDGEVIASGLLSIQYL
jgi:hypothetical protein